ncbi:MAG: hypothetical protein LBK27_09050, partial [Treponema sp.]|nr:hypothetical protein [Treponema sp.]
SPFCPGKPNLVLFSSHCLSPPVENICFYYRYFGRISLLDGSLIINEYEYKNKIVIGDILK